MSRDRIARIMLRGMYGGDLAVLYERTSDVRWDIALKGADELLADGAVFQPPMTKPNAEAGLVERLRADASYIRRKAHASVIPFAAARLDEIADQLPALLSQAGADAMEEAEKAARGTADSDFVNAKNPEDHAYALGRIDAAVAVNRLSATRKGGEG